MLPCDSKESWQFGWLAAGRSLAAVLRKAFRGTFSARRRTRVIWSAALFYSQRIWFINLLLFSSFCCPTLAGEASPAAKPRPAKLHISGYGFFGNRELKRMLRTLDLGGRKPEFFSASFIEDSSLILTSRVRRDGYLKPAIHISVQLADGRKMEFDAASLIETPLPRPLRIVSVRFHVRKGV